jgi:hypothetical protein
MVLMLIVWGENLNIVTKNKDAFLNSSKKDGLKVGAEKS